MIRAKCLLHRTVLLLGQAAFQKAIDSANEVLTIQPGQKHACALLATALHKMGRKKDAAAVVMDICSAYAGVEDVAAAQDDLGCAALCLLVPLPSCALPCLPNPPYGKPSCR